MTGLPKPYEASTHEVWVRRFGGLVDPEGPNGEHQLHGRRALVSWECGLYVATIDGITEYAGCVDRHDGTGYDERLASHHQDVDSWERVWLIPFRPRSL